MDKRPITVECVIRAPMAKVWELWTTPEHIVHWAFASDDWGAPAALNDVRAGGTFKTVMAAKDGPSTRSGQGSARFDFNGTYTAVKKHEFIAYDMDRAPDERASRQVKVEFAETPEGIRVAETFDPEDQNPEGIQRSGWQAILDNFKKYVEMSM